MAPAALTPASKANQESDLSQSFWQLAVELGALDEQQRLAAIEQVWSSAWLAALRQNLHLKTADLEPLLALSQATMTRRAHDQAELDLVTSERLDRLMEVASLAYAVFEQPAHCSTAIGTPV